MKTKYYIAYHFVNGKYCSHTNLKGTETQMKQWVKDNDDTVELKKVVPITKQDYIKDGVHSIDLTGIY